MKILVVEDELELLETIEAVLRQENAVVERATTEFEALDKAMIYDYDCILLDINLPDGSGLKVLEELRKINKSDGVLILSARESIEDKLLGLDLGADDYMTKPFHFAELLARIRSIIRRKKFDGSSLLQVGNIVVDVNNQSVKVNEKELELNRKEFAILMYFISNKNRLVPKTALAEHVWGDYVDDADNFEFIYSQIKNLRKKLSDYDTGVEIQSVYGVGYKMTEL